MKKFLLNSMAALPIAAAALMATTGAAEAAALKLTSGIDTKTVYDNDTNDLSDEVGAVVASGKVGNFTFNVTTGITKPIFGSATQPYLDINNISVSSTAGGVLDILFSETGFTSLDAVQKFLLSAGGTVNGGQVRFKLFADSKNTEFGMTELLADLTAADFSVTGNAFAGSKLASYLDASSDSPFSLTLQAIVTHVGPGISSFDVEATSVPEPSAAAGLAAAALVGGTVVLRKRKQAELDVNA